MSNRKHRKALHPRGQKSARKHDIDIRRKMEARITAIGDSLVEEGLLSELVCFGPLSKESSEGRDFTATMIVDGDPIEHSFGMTIYGSDVANQRQTSYPNVDQWSLPWNINDTTIRKKILGQFDIDVKLSQEIPDKTMREFLS